MNLIFFSNNHEKVLEVVSEHAVIAGAKCPIVCGCKILHHVIQPLLNEAAGVKIPPSPCLVSASMATRPRESRGQQSNNASRFSAGSNHRTNSTIGPMRRQDSAENLSGSNSRSSSRPGSRGSEASLSSISVPRSSSFSSLAVSPAESLGLNESFDDDVSDDDALPEPSYFVDSNAAQYGLSESQTKTVHKLIRVFFCQFL